MNPEASKTKAPSNALLRKVNQYRSYLEEYKKRYKDLRDANKGVQDKNVNLVKENATLRQSASTQAEAIIALKEELVALKEHTSQLTLQYDNYRQETERKIFQYELEKQSSKRTSSFPPDFVSYMFQ